MIKMQLTISEIEGNFELELKAAVTKEGHDEIFYAKKASVNQLIPCQVVGFLSHSQESIDKKTYDFLVKATLAVINELPSIDTTLKDYFKQVKHVDEVIFKQDWVELSIKFLDSQTKE